MDARVAIVGAGPIGIELAIALKKAGISYVQFDARQVGYTISWFAPQTRFFSSNERIAIARVPLQTVDQLKATREEYLTYLRQIVQQFDLTVNAYEPVVGICRERDRFVLTTTPAAGEKRYEVESVVLATGGTAAPNLLGIPGENLPHVSHYFTDPHVYFRQRVLVVGGKNSAAEAALRCYHAGAQVAISYRRERLPEKHIKYWLLPELNTLMEMGWIKSYFNTRPVGITPTHVTLAGPDGAESDVPADFVLLLTGYVADMTLFRAAGVDLQGDRQTPAFNEATMETNVPGLYVAGTAAGGTQQRYTLFLENCHVHVQRIVCALTGHDAAIPTPTFARPES
jgi:thioredoxin reductase (NADPH)